MSPVNVLVNESQLWQHVRMTWEAFKNADSPPTDAHILVAWAPGLLKLPGDSSWADVEVNRSII